MIIMRKAKRIFFFILLIPCVIILIFVRFITFKVYIQYAHTYKENTSEAINTFVDTARTSV